MTYGDQLRELGYKVTDCGDHYRCNAAYRGGDNASSLQVFKDSGVWKDFVTDSHYLPFESLVQKTLKTNDPSIIKQFLSGSQNLVIQKKKELLREEKTYDPACLKKLLPHFDLYLEKGIKESVIKEFKIGLATSGKMYQRYVFPVFNEAGRIQGFSARTANGNSVKWLNTGKKSNWVYPFYSVEKCRESILSSRKLILVESIGDAIALCNAGAYNVLVTFGTTITPKLSSFVSSLDVDEVYIALNNDRFNSKENRNRGVEGAIRVFDSLLNCMDLETLYYLEIPKNDFGDMEAVEIAEFITTLGSFNHKENIERFIEEANKASKLAENPKPLADKLKKIKKRYKECYS